MPAPRHPSTSRHPAASQNATARPSRAAQQNRPDDASGSNGASSPLDDVFAPQPSPDEQFSTDEQSSTRPSSTGQSSNGPSHPPLSDIYQRLTDQIIAKVEAGAGEWRMPWHSAEARGLPVNALTRKTYRGGNILPLWIAAAAAGYESHEWATYKQWREAGAQVKKGERSSPVVFWKFKDQEEVPDATQAEFNDRASRLILVRGYSVFNAAQVDGYTPKLLPLLPEPERVEAAEAFLRYTQATIKTGGGRAFYSPSADEIVVPRIERFPSAVSYYGVALHELVHWTGHETRLDRDLLTATSREEYAREELVAELGAAFLCASLGFANEPRRDNAAYVASWLKALKEDPKAIFSAASKAQYAADYLHGLQPVMPQPEDVGQPDAPRGFSAARRPQAQGLGL